MRVVTQSFEIGVGIGVIAKDRSIQAVLLNVNSAVYEIKWKNMVETDSSQMTTQYGACALHAV